MLRTRASDTRAVLNAIGRSQAMIEFALDGTVLHANELFCTLLGYSLSEINGRHHSMFVEQGEQESPAYKAFWADLRRGEPRSGEFRRLGKGGSEVWIQGSYNPVLDGRGRPVKVVKVATDVTAQKLRTADVSGQLSAIGKSQAVIEFELDGTIITANENFCTAMGYALAEIQGKHHRMFVKRGHEQTPEYRALWDGLRRGEFRSGEFMRVGKGGREVWIQASYNPILDPVGRPFKVVKYATDVTQMVRRRQESERIAGLVDQALDKIVVAVSTSSQQSAMAASAAVETSSTVQAVASAANQFDASAQEIAKSMSVSRAAVDRTMAETQAADEATRTLTRAAEAMNGIVEIIQTIAGQINLLALNATIESARAGEAGKGFAVVATEVKNLANQVAAAIGQISGEISSVQRVSADVVSRLQHIHDGVASVQESVTVAAGAIEEQSAASQEITANMQNAATAVGDISASLEQISLSVGEAKGLAEDGIGLYRSLQQDAA